MLLLTIHGGHAKSQNVQDSKQEMNVDKLTLSALLQNWDDHANGEERTLETQEMGLMFTKDLLRNNANGRWTRNSEKSSRKKRKAIMKNNYRWLGQEIPYFIAPGMFNMQQKALIQDAIYEWQKYSCLRFVPWTAGTENFVAFISGNRCSSMVGMRENMQYVRLGSHCLNKRNVLHEIGHVLGFHHEHSRPDRDNYVDILYENVQGDQIENFFKRPYAAVNLYHVPYDYESIMHYSETSSSKNGKPTIITLDPAYQKKIGHGEQLSFYDIKLANLMYSCEKLCPRSIDCPDDGFVGEDCKCYCRGNPIGVCNGESGLNKTGQARKVPGILCQDKWDRIRCSIAASRGYCFSHRAYMTSHCNATCRMCNPNTLGPYEMSSGFYEPASSIPQSREPTGHPSAQMTSFSFPSETQSTTPNSAANGDLSNSDFVVYDAYSTPNFASVDAQSTSDSASLNAQSIPDSASLNAQSTSSSVSLEAQSTPDSVSVVVQSTPGSSFTYAKPPTSSRATASTLPTTDSQTPVGLRQASTAWTSGKASTMTSSTRRLFNKGTGTAWKARDVPNTAVHQTTHQPCRDKMDTRRCRDAASREYCSRYRMYMEEYCRASCNLCGL